MTLDRSTTTNKNTTRMRNECLLFLLLMAGRVGGVRITQLEVPGVALEGDLVHLRCHYQNEGGSSLYTLKWYKDGREFYRHMPGLPAHASAPRCEHHAHYNVPGVTIDCLVSTERDLVLEGVTTTTTGEYQCEVIGEHPNFRKEIKKAWLTVYKEPLQRPQLSGGKDSYSPLDLIDLNCSSLNTEYTPVLTWHINGRPANESTVRAVGARTEVLVLPAQDAHFPQGVMTVACVASLGSAHTASSGLTLYTSHYLTAQEYYHNTGVKKTGSEEAVWVLLVVALLVIVLVQETDAL